jgi:hypothetical protein
MLRVYAGMIRQFKLSEIPLFSRGCYPISCRHASRFTHPRLAVNAIYVAE